MDSKEKTPTQIDNIDNAAQTTANNAANAQATANDISAPQSQPSKVEALKQRENKEKSSSTKKQPAKNNKNDSALVDKNDDALVGSEAKSKLSNDKDAKSKTKLTVRDYIYLALAVVLMGILVTCVVIFAVGFRPAVVLTPSMKPNINPGSLVLVKSIDPEKIEVGDVIMFWPSSGTTETDKISVTHRVIKITVNDAGLRTFTTHGDANGEGSNETVTQSQVIGKVHFVIPAIGALFLFVKNNLFVVMFGVIALICLWYMISISIKNKKAKQAASANANKKTPLDANKNSNADTNIISNDVNKQNDSTKNINTNQNQKNVASKNSHKKGNKRK